MALSEPELLILCDEIKNQTHPVTGAYSANDQTAANQMNADNLSAPDVETDDAEEFIELFDPGEVAALGNNESTKHVILLMLTGRAGYRKTGGASNNRDHLVTLFGVNSTTVANYDARYGGQLFSRADQLFGRDVTPGDVQKARTRC